LKQNEVQKNATSLNNYVGFEVWTAVAIKNAIFCVLMPRISVEDTDDSEGRNDSIVRIKE
jgi:hypothetical protein